MTYLLSWRRDDLSLTWHDSNSKPQRSNQSQIKIKFHPTFSLVREAIWQ